VATNPYVPNLVPSLNSDNEMALVDLERFLNDELRLISEAIRTTSVQAAYGGLIIDTPRTSTVGTTPAYIEAWDSFYPPQPSRITTNDVPIGAADPLTVLTVLEDGVYMADCQVNVEISTGRTYNLRLRKNDLVTPVYGTWDTSNQTGQIWMKFGAMIEGKAGDVFSVWGSSTQDGSTFDIQSANFQIFRISELIKVRP
jgi:hypothetical protein